VSREHQQQRFVFNALWESPTGEEEDRSGMRQHNTVWITRTFRHIEVAPIVTLESGRPVNPLTGVDSNQSHSFPLSARPLAFRRNSLPTPALATMDFRVLKYFPYGGVKPPRPGGEILQFVQPCERLPDQTPFFGSWLRYPDLANPLPEQVPAKSSFPWILNFEK